MLIHHFIYTKSTIQREHSVYSTILVFLLIVQTHKPSQLFCKLYCHSQLVDGSDSNSFTKVSAYSLVPSIPFRNRKSSVASQQRKHVTIHPVTKQRSRTSQPTSQPKPELNGYLWKFNVTLWPPVTFVILRVTACYRHSLKSYIIE